MSEKDYVNALNMGRKEVRRCISKGEYPYLTALDSFLPEECDAYGSYVGYMQIPMDHIVGTRSQGRTNCFARNFMPIMGERSEFGVKWQTLCEAHLTEGIRDPIKVYEYMNRYYVEEGNKRVSVLKYFGAVEIPAQVTRIMPEQNGSPEVERYNELLRFIRCTGINNVEFSEAGGYAELQASLCKGVDERWTEEEVQDFNAAFSHFKEALSQRGGYADHATPGDDLLAYIRIFGIRSLYSKTTDMIRKDLDTVWEEIRLQDEEEKIEVLMDPSSEKKPGLVSKLIPTKKPEMQFAAFIYDKNPDASLWARSHEEGRAHVEETLNRYIRTEAYFNAMDSDPEEILRQAIESGNNIIFTTSPRLLPASLRMAVQHPEVTIFNCCINQSHRYIRTYYARMYEVKFITGVIAGALSASGQIGYICDYPIFGQIAGINAFAIGASMVNPRARIRLEWSGTNGLEAARKKLVDEGINLISLQDSYQMHDGCLPSFGLSQIKEGKTITLAQPVWQWGTYYETLLRRFLDNSLKDDLSESRKALNYYWGLSAGVVDLKWSEQLPDSVIKLAKVVRQSILNGTCEPFHEPLYSKEGRVKGEWYHTLSPEQIIEMDWLVENVDGEIPTYDQLNETGRYTVDIVGVSRAVQRNTEG